MKKIITQIYEIQTPLEAAQAVAAGVDHIGSVVVSETDWQVPSIYETIRFVAQAGARSSLILLFSQPELVCDSLAYYQPDIVHFCEHLAHDTADGGLEETSQALVLLQKRIRSKFPKIKIMRTIPLPAGAGEPDIPFLELAGRFEPVSDYFLTDTLLQTQSTTDEQPVDGFVGITGQTCDWAAARKLVATSRIPVILAGGMSPENVYKGIRMVRPAGVDSCTRTNALDDQGKPLRFRKDFERVKAFISEVRRAEADFLL